MCSRCPPIRCAVRHARQGIRCTRDGPLHAPGRAQPREPHDAQWGDNLAAPIGGRLVTASDRQGLMPIRRGVARERINVTAVRTQSRSDLAHMRFSFEVADVAHLRRAFAAVKDVAGVIRVARG